MKKLIVAMGLFTLSGTWVAAQAPNPPDRSQDPATPRQPAAMDPQKTGDTAAGGKQMSAEVVSVDAHAKTITIMSSAIDAYGSAGSTGSTGSSDQSMPGTAGKTQTLKVEGSAVASLSTVHKGDKVMLTCRSGSAGSTTTPPATDSSFSNADCAAVTSISKSH
jgi:Cu/Ag efflux protein CusF